MITCQALVIGLGGWLMLRSARASLDERIERGVVTEHARASEKFASVIERECDGPLEYGSRSWEHVQKRVEEFAAPSGSMLVVLDDHGRVLCHPSLRGNPGLRTLDISAQVLKLDDTGELVELASLRPQGVATGVAQALDGRAVMAVSYSPKARARVLVTQVGGGLATASARAAESVMIWCAATGAVLLGLSLAGSWLLVRRYDSMLMRVNQQLEHEVDRRTRRALDIRNGLIFGLAKLADFRDSDTGRHLERIRRYAVLLSEELRTDFPEIDRAWIERIALASSMHDIGKVGVPDTVLLKPGRYIPEERRVMETHALIGADTLIAIKRRVGEDDLLMTAIQVALSHHERWDGGGYPFGLKQEQIPLPARIVALADMYDALTSRRVYKPAYAHAEACRIIRENRGTHLDPRVVDAFERVRSQFDEIRSELSSGEDFPARRLDLVAARVKDYHDQRAIA